MSTNPEPVATLNYSSGRTNADGQTPAAATANEGGGIDNPTAPTIRDDEEEIDIDPQKSSVQ